MAKTPKRLKRNISFSAHEKDIYDYLDGVDNASALIKRLVYNHMIMEQGLVTPVAPVIVKSSVKNDNQNVPQETSDSKEQSQDTDKSTEEQPQDQIKKLTPEEQENQFLMNQLPY